MVLCFIFKALGHLDFILAYSRRECSNFIHLLVAVQLSQHHLVKRLSFLRCMFLLPLLIDCGWVSLFLFFKLIIIILWKDTLRLYKYPITHQFFTFWHPLIILALINYLWWSNGSIISSTLRAFPCLLYLCGFLFYKMGYNSLFFKCIIIWCSTLLDLFRGFPQSGF